MPNGNVNPAVNVLRRGMYCEDCDRIMDIATYSEHNADHTLRPIEWDFVRERKE